MHILNLMKRAAQACLFAFLFLCFFALFFVSSDKVYSAQQEPSPSQKTGNIPDVRKTMGMTQVGAFAIERNAYALAEKLDREGATTYIAEGVTTENKKIYRLFVKRDAKSPENPPKPAKPKQLSVQAQKTLLVAQSAGRATSTSRNTISSDEMPQFATFRIFSNRRDAEEFARELEEKGFTAVLKKQAPRGRQTTYTVYAERPLVQPEVTVPPVRQERAMTPEERISGAQDREGVCS